MKLPWDTCLQCHLERRTGNSSVRQSRRLFSDWPTRCAEVGCTLACEERRNGSREGPTPVTSKQDLREARKKNRITGATYCGGLEEEEGDVSAHAQHSVRVAGVWGCGGGSGCGGLCVSVSV